MTCITQIMRVNNKQEKKNSKTQPHSPTQNESLQFHGAKYYGQWNP